MRHRLHEQRVQTLGQIFLHIVHRKNKRYQRFPSAGFLIQLYIDRTQCKPVSPFLCAGKKCFCSAGSVPAHKACSLFQNFPDFSANNISKTFFWQILAQSPEFIRQPSLRGSITGSQMLLIHRLQYQHLPFCVATPSIYCKHHNIIHRPFQWTNFAIAFLICCSCKCSKHPQNLINVPHLVIHSVRVQPDFPLYKKRNWKSIQMVSPWPKVSFRLRSRSRSSGRRRCQVI